MSMDHILPNVNTRQQNLTWCYLTWVLCLVLCKTRFLSANIAISTISTNTPAFYRILQKQFCSKIIISFRPGQSKNNALVKIYYRKGPNRALRWSFVLYRKSWHFGDDHLSAVKPRLSKALWSLTSLGFTTLPVKDSEALKQGILKGKYHCTIDLQFDLFGLVCFANKNKNWQ